jgi:hypothetical protein
MLTDADGTGQLRTIIDGLPTMPCSAWPDSARSVTVVAACGVDMVVRNYGEAVRIVCGS